MKAEIIAIGTELIIGHTVNTNATYISEELNSLGISVHYHSAVGDNAQRIQDCLRQACSRSDLVILTGGLGPTDDDISHDVISQFTGLKLVECEEQKKLLEEKYKDLGRKTIPLINYKMTRVIDGANVIPNPIGTAIGMIFDIEAKKLKLDSGYKNQPESITLISFPGVPVEMKAMLDSIKPRLKEKLKDQGHAAAIVSKKIRLTNITESKMAQTILDYYEKNKMPNPFLESNPSLAPYATLGECYLRITASADIEAEAWKLIEETGKVLHEIFPEEIYGYDEDTIHSVLAQKLKEKNLSISFAESCTGGLASKMLTDIPGSSEYTKLNLVTYADEAKVKMLKVSEKTLKEHGAVSEACAKEMAQGLAKISEADINVSITGIAGPDGATEEKPVGTIYVTVIIKGEVKFSEKLIWGARKLSREQVRELACKRVFSLIIKLIDQL